MKKISVFLAAIMMFVMVATSMGNAETVQAFSNSEISYYDYEWYKSSKAGEGIHVSYYISDYASAESLDVTGWKAALCPVDSLTLDKAVVTFDITNANKGMAGVYINATLPSDIPAGRYVAVIFDAQGNVKAVDSSSGRTYVNKTLASANCWLMNDDGYAYAYVYSENPAINASTYPTLYAADKTTVVTSFVDYTVGQGLYGDTVHYYKLKILDASAFAFDENGYTYLYYSMGTSNLSSGNDGGVGLVRCDASGLDWTKAVDLNKRAAEYPEMFSVDDPFAGGASSPTTSTIEQPVESEHTLPNGEEVRMVTVKGNPYVYVIGDPEVIPTGSSFSSTPVTVGDGYTLPVAAVEKYVGKGLQTAVFQMDLTAADGAAITQLGDYINVTLPIPASITLDEGKTIVMYRYEDNGRLTRLDTVVDGNMVTFATNHFSLYIMVEQDASAGPALLTATSPKTGEVNMMPALIATISAVGIAVVVMKKKNAI